MTRIEYLAGHVVYDNPKPHVHSRHGYFPGLLQLPSGELLGLFMLAEAFEAPNGTTWITRSSDGGVTWKLQGPLYDKSKVGFETTDTLKATLLRDGRLIALGYRFHRHDLEEGIAIPATGGIQPGDDLVTFSCDQGRSWENVRDIPRSYPELLEISGPCVELRSGELLASAALFKMPDGSSPNSQRGVLLRSRDQGRSWDDTQPFSPPGNNFTPFESRLCQMPDDRLVILTWAFDCRTDTHLPNCVFVSHDEGRTWSQPIGTGHMGQASSLISLVGDLLLTIHAHRGENPGLVVRLIDFERDVWRPLAEETIYGGRTGPQTRIGQDMAQMFHSLRFGQPSLLKLAAGEILATHWCVEDGQGKIRTHRLAVAP